MRAYRRLSSSNVYRFNCSCSILLQCRSSKSILWWREAEKERNRETHIINIDCHPLECAPALYFNTRTQKVIISFIPRCFSLHFLFYHRLTSFSTFLARSLFHPLTPLATSFHWLWKLSADVCEFALRSFSRHTDTLDAFDIVVCSSFRFFIFYFCCFFSRLPRRCRHHHRL